jgi:hypothetical protein
LGTRNLIATRGGRSAILRLQAADNEIPQWKSTASGLIEAARTALRRTKLGRGEVPAHTIRRAAWQHNEGEAGLILCAAEQYAVSFLLSKIERQKNTLH